MNTPMWCVRGFVSLFIAVLLLASVNGDTALSISINSPTDTINYQSITFDANTNINASCELVLEGNTVGSSTSQKTKHIWEHTLATDGKKKIEVYCVSSNNSSNTKTKESTFTIDTIPPVIESHNPSETNQESIEFTINTNEEGVCRYSYSPNKDFFEMGTLFDVTGYKIHKTRLNFEEDGIYDLYIRCRDNAGNINQNDYRATLIVDIPPSARVVMDEPSPVRAGTIFVRVITSEPLIGTPTLRYSLQDSQGRTENFNVPLSGSGHNWEGYMIISESGGKRVGSFQFSGIDYGGNTGTKITSGRNFIVDSVSPPRIEDFRVNPLDNGRMRLEWEYDYDRDIDRYIILRSTSPGVTRLDFHDHTYTKGFIDYGLSDNTIYFYRVLAVDKAGNYGVLSREVDGRARNVIPQQQSTSSQETQSQSSSQSSGLSENLMPILRDSISKYQGMKKLVDDLVLGYRAQNKIEENIMTDLGILNKISGAKAKVYSYMNEFEDLKKRDLSESQLRTEIRSIEIKLETVKSEIMTSINEKQRIDINSQANMQQVMNSVDGLMNLFRIINLDPKIREKYIEESLKINERILVTGTIYLFEVNYFDGNSEEIVFVSKEINQIGEQRIDEQGLMVVEEIDESVVANVRDITFISPRPDTLRQVMVKWDLDKINNEIKYYIQGSFGDISDSKFSTALLDNYKLYFDELGRKAEEPRNNLITGRSISLPSFENFRSFVGVVIGILVVAGLAIYYFSIDSEESVIDKLKKKKKNLIRKKK